MYWCLVALQRKHNSSDILTMVAISPNLDIISKPNRAYIKGRFLSISSSISPRLEPMLQDL